MLNVARWKYIGTNEYHIGPIAEQFYNLFGTGINNTSISTIDPSGVALLGVQQLIEENNSLKASLDEQRKLLEQLQQRLNEMEKQLIRK
jgi:hypothetical protein